MATVFSAQPTNSRAIPAVKNKANELGGRIRVAHGTFEASSLASGDVIEMAEYTTENFKNLFTL